MPRAPEDVTIGLKNVRPTMELRWNGAAKQVGERSFDVNGVPREKEYEPRWELWDTDPHGNEYMITTLEDQSGRFKEPGMWLVELIRTCDPARYDGDLGKMCEALVDLPNEIIEGMAEKSYEDFVNNMAETVYRSSTSRVTVPSMLQG